MIPALGPRSVLWTVDVTISQKGNGDGTTPAATRPETGLPKVSYKVAKYKSHNHLLRDFQ